MMMLLTLYVHQCSTKPTDESVRFRRNLIARLGLGKFFIKEKKHMKKVSIEKEVRFDDIYDNYYHKLTEEQKEWLDEGDTGLTCCDKCDIIQSWEGEVFCKGDDWEENVNCHPYDVLCYSCYHENSRTLRAIFTTAYYKAVDFLYRRKNT